MNKSMKRKTSVNKNDHEGYDTVCTIHLTDDAKKLLQCPQLRMKVLHDGLKLIVNSTSGKHFFEKNE